LAAPFLPLHHSPVKPDGFFICARLALNTNRTSAVNEGPGRRFFLVNEDQLRQLILDYSPDIRRDTDRMGDLMRELIKFEREKAGFDKPGGTIELSRNRTKKEAGHPDLIGSGVIAGRSYRVVAWFPSKGKIRIRLLPRNTK
jgi:hypothetical protein